MTLTEANNLIGKYIQLKEEVCKSSDKKILDSFLKHERKCLEQFKYIILMKTSKYKQYANYDDLNQECLDALLQAFNSFDPNKGSIFWWIHKYVDTRISRSVRLHTAIKFPLKYIKTITPQRLTGLPILIDTLGTPDVIFENKETWNIIKKTIAQLSLDHREVVNMAFGIDGEIPQSVTKISHKLKLSKVMCEKILNQAICMIKQEMF